jgi:hypothetical protein
MAFWRNVSRRRPVIVLLWLILPFVAACGTGAGGGNSSQAWTVYHDARFPMQVPVPPGWRPGSFDAGPIKNETCKYAVDFFPPGRPVNPGLGAHEYEQLLIIIMVNVSCDQWTQAGDPVFQPDPTPLTISGTPAILYNNTVSAARPSEEQVVEVTFGGYQYLFVLAAHVTPDQAQQAHNNFMQMLQGFKYTGG